MKPLLEASGLGLRLDGRWLFRKLDFALLPGEFVALTGPSGSGKTSLLSCLAGLREPTEGAVTLHVPARSPLGFIHQDLYLAPGDTVLRNALGGRLRRHSSLGTLLGFPKQDQADALALLHELGLAGHERKWASETSRGEQQRIAIARALLAEPPLFLADEPVASLDHSRAENVLARLRREADEHDRPTLASLHDPEQVKRHADRELTLSPNDPEAWTLRVLAHRREGAPSPEGEGRISRNPAHPQRHEDA